MNSYQDVIVAGFGGQGVMLIGTLLAYAAMEDGQNVTYLPVYGPEMRGGTANCTVVVSREDIGSPIIRNARSLIAISRESRMGASLSSIPPWSTWNSRTSSVFA